MPEKFSHARKSVKRVTVAAPLLVWFRRQAEGSRQLRIRFRDVFVTAPAGQPAVEGSRHHAPLLQRGFRNECAAKVVKLGGVAATFRIPEDSRILAKVPKNAHSGRWSVGTATGSAVSPQRFVVTTPAT